MIREGRSAGGCYWQAMADGLCIRRPPPSPAALAGKSAILRRQYARTYDIGDHMGTVACPRFEPHIFYVAFNRTGRDVELYRHFLGGKAECDKAEYLGFSVRQFNRGINIVVHGYPQSCTTWTFIMKPKSSVQFSSRTVRSLFDADDRQLGPIVTNTCLMTRTYTYCYLRPIADEVLFLRPNRLSLTVNDDPPYVRFGQ